MEYWHALLLVGIGFLAGFINAVAGGGSLLTLPLLIFLGYSAQDAVGTSFMGILVISMSALFAHGRMAHVDYKTGILLGVGGIIGAQVVAYLLQYVPTQTFKKIFALLILGMAVYMFFKK